MTAPLLSSQNPSPSFRRSPVLSAVLIILFAVTQLFLAGSVIPRFEEIFHDMIGNRPLPTVTVIVLHYRWAMAAVASIGFAIFAIRSKQSGGWSYAILALVILQVAITIIALFIPLHAILKAMNP